MRGQQPYFREHLLYINGEWVPQTDGEVMEDRNPADGSVMAMVHMGGRQDAEKALAAAYAARGKWAATAPDVRERILLRAANEMEARAEGLTQLMIAESGSARYKAWGEVMGSAGILRVAAGECRRLHGEVLQPGGPGQMSMAVRSPLGVVLGITPFNYPMILAIKKLAYALAAGNTFILKPSPLTPATGLAIAGVFEAAGLPSGVLNVVPGRSEVIGDMLVDDPRVRMVTFTGSSAVGRSIAVRAARDLKKVAMELGGKNPLIVLKDFDPVQAADIAAYGAFCHQGQVCMATSRIIVEGDGYQPFCDALVCRAEGLKVGDPREEDTIIGPLIQPEKWKFIDGQIEDALSKGAKLLTGGRHEGPWYWPTVLADVTPEMRIFHEETFGPVTSVMRAKDPEEALALCNDNEYGLSAALLTHNLELAWSMGLRMEAGMVHINDTTFLSGTTAPSGGVKFSGFGREGGRYSMEDFTELKWLTMQVGPKKMPF